MKTLLNLIITILIAIPTYAQTVDEIIEKHIEALGGKDKLRQLRSARIDAVVSVSSFEIKSTTIVLQGQGVRSEQEIQGMKIIQAFDGNTAWVINPMAGNDKATRLPAEQNAALKSQMDLTGLYNYKAKGYNLELKGEEVLDGAPVYVIEVKMPDGSNAINYMSKSTYYTLKTRVNMKTGDGNEIQTQIYSSDYKTADGYVTPYLIEIEGGGMPGRITTKVTSAQFNIDVDPSVFAFPEEP